MKCLNCGLEFEEMTAPYAYCPKCRAGVVYYKGSPLIGEITPLDAKYGWICPKCGRSLAPWVNQCPCNEVTAAWGTEKPFIP